MATQPSDPKPRPRPPIPDRIVVLRAYGAALGASVGGDVASPVGTGDAVGDGSPDGVGSLDPLGDGEAIGVSAGVGVGDGEATGVGDGFGVGFGAGARQTTRGGFGARPAGVAVPGGVGVAADAGGLGLAEPEEPDPAAPGLAAFPSTIGSVPGAGKSLTASARIPSTSGIWIEPRGSGCEAGRTSG